MSKQILSFLFLCTYQFVAGQPKDYPIKGVEFTNVKLTDQFWLPRIRINHLVTIPASFERCDKTGRINNFVMAAERKGKFCTIFPFDDTDIYKTIEGASYSLSLFPDATLEAYIDSLITIIGRAQEPDGYLYTARTIDPTHPHAWSGAKRWEKEREMSHELYNAGHLYEAASAYYLATGKKSLLNIALKNADLVCSVFGPDKKHVAPGHEVVEMGLVKLYRITGKAEYLTTAKFFVEERGHYNGYDSTSTDPFKNGSYWQDDKPVIDQTEAEGHAVRAGYLYSAMADIAALTGDVKLLNAIDTIWNNFVSRKIYIQGGAGAVPDGERYGADYDLPNTTAYNETCAAIANIFWNQRMFLLHGDSKYIDVVEKIMYNGFISGLGLDGKSFFYTNAMQVKNSFSHGSLETERSGWFPCSCCPTNVVRLLPSVPGYVYAQKEDALFINLFISSRSTIHVLGKEVEVIQENNYPWDGRLKFDIHTSAPVTFSLKIRIPGWAENSAVPSDLYSFENAQTSRIPVTINGEATEYKIENGYAVFNRKWNGNTLIEVRLPMEVKRIHANKKVKSDIGKVALQRGPLIFCAEGIDNNGRVANFVLPDKALFNTEFRPDLLNGVITIKSHVPGISIEEGGQGVQMEMKTFTAIPYYAWANRGNGEMIVWFPEKIKDIDIISSE
ncbi:MAG TPA: beta-L-arabinofuranosidase domain-containing protein [Puia sp.]|jgi:hypothetical protein